MTIYEYDRPIVIKPCNTPEQRAALEKEYEELKRKNRKQFEENLKKLNSQKE